jgi:acetyl/propionyl-CoA carboxylase alpha subunit
MNTRIEVEHPVTETITGVDLMRKMLRNGDGAPLAYKQSDIAFPGDIAKRRPIERAEYDSIVADIDGTNAKLSGALSGH